MFITDPALPYIIAPGREADVHLINEIPHTPFIVGLPWNIPDEFSKETFNHTIGVGDRFYSPDDRYYMEYTAAAGSRFMSAAMFDLETGEQVAHAYKYDWRPNIVGWAADSSGAFVLFGDNGQDGGLLIKLLAPGAEKGLDLKEAPAPTSPPLPPTYTPVPPTLENN